MAQVFENEPTFVESETLVEALDPSSEISSPALDEDGELPLVRPHVYTVTNLNNSGPESLRECMEASRPRICNFAIGGWIPLVSDIRVTSPYLTVSGGTAPGPGIMLRGSGIEIAASHVLVQDLFVRPGDDPQPACCARSSCPKASGRVCSADPGSRDGIRIRAASGPISNVTVDHVSIDWALDEGLSIVTEMGEISNVTVSNSIIASGLDMSIHPEASDPLDPGHSKAVLVTGKHAVGGLTFVGNLLAHNADRNIRVAVPVSMEFLNNVVYNWSRGKGVGHTIELTNSMAAVHYIDLVGNNFIPGPDTFCPENISEVFGCSDSGDARTKMHAILRVGGGALNPLSRYFIADNIGPTRYSPTLPEWDAVDKSLFLNRKLDLLRFFDNRATSPVAYSGAWRAMTSEESLPYVLENVGARSSARDVVDIRTIEDVRGRRGQIINCVSADGSERCEKNAGGWPTFENEKVEEIEEYEGSITPLSSSEAIPGI